jgi:hypothetical protein
MDATQFAENVKRALRDEKTVKSVQYINPELVTGKTLLKPRVALQVETDPHQTFILLVF